MIGLPFHCTWGSGSYPKRLEILDNRIGSWIFHEPFPGRGDVRHIQASHLPFRCPRRRGGLRWPDRDQTAPAGARTVPIVDIDPQAGLDSAHESNDRQLSRLLRTRHEWRACR
jgi:hypothetical protein